jgi:lipid-A-disaccharide synthase-like uncharacterized protein
VASAIFQKGGFAFGMRFLRLPRVEIKRRIPSLGKKLVGHGDLAESWRVMKSFQFLADMVLGVATNFWFWKIIGWSGNVIFGIRFVIQWIASERARKSVIPVGFWECSAVGSVLLLCYFAIYRHDSVGVLSSAMPLPIYLRNLYFRYTHREPQHPGNAPRPPE